MQCNRWGSLIYDLDGAGHWDSDLSCFVRVVVSQGSGAYGLVVKCLWSGSRFRVRDEVACTVSNFDPRIDEFSACFMSWISEPRIVITGAAGSGDATVRVAVARSLQRLQRNR